MMSIAASDGRERERLTVLDHLEPELHDGAHGGLRRVELEAQAPALVDRGPGALGDLGQALLDLLHDGVA